MSRDKGGNGIQEVVSSIPIGSTNLDFRTHFSNDRSQNAHDPEPSHFVESRRIAVFKSEGAAPRLTIRTSRSALLPPATRGSDGGRTRRRSTRSAAADSRGAAHASCRGAASLLPGRSSLVDLP